MEKNNYIVWRIDFNRPLSTEELAVARRLDRLTVDQWTEIYGEREAVPLRAHFEQE